MRTETNNSKLREPPSSSHDDCMAVLVDEMRVLMLDSSCSRWRAHGVTQACRLLRASLLHFVNIYGGDDGDDYEMGGRRLCNYASEVEAARVRAGPEEHWLRLMSP